MEGRRSSSAASLQDGDRELSGRGLTEYDLEVEAVHLAAVSKQPVKNRTPKRNQGSRIYSPYGNPLFSLPVEQLELYDYRPPSIATAAQEDTRSPALQATANKAARAVVSRGSITPAGANRNNQETPAGRMSNGNDTISTAHNETDRGDIRRSFSPYLDYVPGRVSTQLISNIDQSVLRAETEEQRWNGTPADIFADTNPIKYFAENTNSDVTKFVYLNEVEDPKGLRHNPYDLVVVPYAEVKKQYYTMSANGVTFVGGSGHSEFTPTAEWVRQADLFKLVSNLGVFKNYRYWKTMRIWRMFVRQRRFQKNKKALMSRIFTLNPLFMACVKDVVLLCLRTIDKATLIDIQFEASYSEKGFQDVQFEAKRQMRNTISQTVDFIKNRIQALIDAVQDPARIKVTDVQRGASRRTVSLRQIMLMEKQKALERARKAEMVNAEIRVIGKLIRLCDYIMLEHFVDLTVHELDRVLGVLRMEKSMVFRTELRFNSAAQLEFTPDREAVRGLLLSTVKDVVEMLAKMPRVLFHQKFLQYVALSGMIPTELASTGPHIHDFLQALGYPGVVEEEMNSLVNTSYDAADNFAEQFQDLTPIHKFGLTWNLEEYKAATLGNSEVEDKSSKDTVPAGLEGIAPELIDPRLLEDDDEDAPTQPVSLEVFQRDLKQFAAWAVDVQGNLQTSTRGILLIDGKNLKDGLRPVPEKATQDVINLLVNLANERTSILQARLLKDITRISKTHHDLVDFVAFARFLKRMPARKSWCIYEKQLLDDLHALLKDHNAEFESSASAQQRSMLDATFQRFNATANRADHHRSELMQRYQRQLEKSVSAINVTLDQINSKLTHGGRFLIPEAQPTPLLEELDVIIAQVTEVKRTAENYAAYQAVLGLQVDATKRVNHIETLVHGMKATWELARRWQTLMGKLGTTAFTSLHPVDDLQQPVEECAQMLDELRMDTEGSKKEVAESPVLKSLQTQISKHQAWLPQLVELANPCMQARHWNKIFHAVDEQYEKSLIFTLSQLVSFGVLDHPGLIAEVSRVATGESEIDSKLKEIESTWDTRALVTVPYSTIRAGSSKKGVFVLMDVDVIFQDLEEHEMALASMLSSFYVTGLVAEVEAMRERLARTSHILTEWQRTQELWLYLDPVFSLSDDIASQLPNLAAKFRLVDRRWKLTMRNTNKFSTLAEATTVPGLLQQLQELTRSMESIIRNLGAFFESRRQKFPRLYFLSDEQVLKMLSKVAEPDQVEPYLSLLFDNIAGLELGEDEHNPEIVAIVSHEGEHVFPGRPVQAYGPVEGWVADLEDAVHKALYNQLHRALGVYEKYLRHDWMFKYPAQVVLVGSHIMWVREMESILSGTDVVAALNKYRQTLRQQLVTLAEIVSSLQVPALQLSLVSSMIVMDLYRISVVSRLIENNVSTRDHYLWAREIRYYWDADLDTCVVRQMAYSVGYGFEYQGNVPSLVITPATEKCYRNLLGAMEAHRGGFITGGSGAGKTETLNSLARTLGQFCLHVPATMSPALSVALLGRLLAGTVQAGVWLCLDNPTQAGPVLSVLVESLHAIQAAAASAQTEVTLQGTRMPLVASAGFFITATLFDPGSCARVTLPLSLVNRFRTVHLAVADRVLLAEVLLYAHGFKAARALAGKLFVAFNVGRQHLHARGCEWGPRAFKAVLSVACGLKRAEADLPEDIAVTRAVVEVMAPRLPDASRPLLQHLLATLFARLSETRSLAATTLANFVIAEMEARHMLPLPRQVSKILQLHDALSSGCPLVVTGPACCGKTTCIQVLAGALRRLAASGKASGGILSPMSNAKVGEEGDVKVTVVYAHASPPHMLLGRLRRWERGEWIRDGGMLPNVLRRLPPASASSRSWVVVDGVLGEWAESLIPLLSPERTLFLFDGERVQLPTNARLIFESRTLENTSPAILSRCAVVTFQEGEDVTLSQIDAGATRLSSAFEWTDAVEAWLAALTTNDDASEGSSGNVEDATVMRDTLAALIHRKLERTLKAIKDTLPVAALEAVSDHSFVQTVLSFLEVFAVKGKLAHVPANFTMSIVWAAAGLLTSQVSEEAVQFAAWLMEDYKDIISFPSNVSPFACTVDTQSGTIVSVSHVSARTDSEVPISSATSLDAALVLAEKLVIAGRSVLLFGEQRSSRTNVLQRLMARLEEKSKQTGEEEHMSFTCTFASLPSDAPQLSSAGTASATIAAIRRATVRYTRTAVGAPPGTRACLFIDDVVAASQTSTPVPASSHSEDGIPCEVLEALRHVFEQGGFMECTSSGVSFTNVLPGHLQVVVAVDPGDLPYFVHAGHMGRLFQVVPVHNSTRADLASMYFDELVAFFAHFGGPTKQKKQVEDLVITLVEMTLKVLDGVKEHFPRSPRLWFNGFEAEDAGAVFRAMLRLSKSSRAHFSTLVSLWRYELDRVFLDRLATEEARVWYTDLVEKIVKRELHNGEFQKDVLFASLTSGGSASEDDEADGDGLSSDAIYDTYQAVDMESFVALVQRAVQAINHGGGMESGASQMISPKMVQYVAAVHRAITPRSCTHGSHLCIVAEPGTTSRNAVLIAAQIANMEVREPHLLHEPQYADQGPSVEADSQGFMAEVRQAVARAGVNNVPVVMLITSDHLAFPYVPQILLNVLASNSYDQLFDAPEFRSMASNMRNIKTVTGAAESDAQDRGDEGEDDKVDGDGENKGDTGDAMADALVGLFCRNVRRNFHVAVVVDGACRDTGSGVFIERLARACTVMVEPPVGEVELRSIGTLSLVDALVAAKVPHSTATAALKVAQRIHTEAPYCNVATVVTPQFAQLCEMTSVWYVEKATAAQESIEARQRALAVIDQVKAEVADYKRSTGDPDVEEDAPEGSRGSLMQDLRSRIREDRSRLDEWNAELASLSSDITAVKERINEEEASVAAVLEESSERLEEVWQDAKGITLEDVDKLKSTLAAAASAPENVLRCMEAVSLVHGHPDPSWPRAKELLADAEMFMASVGGGLGPSVITANVRSLLEPYVVRSEFNVESIDAEHKLVKLLVSWILALCEAFDSNEKTATARASIEGLKEKLADLETTAASKRENREGTGSREELETRVERMEKELAELMASEEGGLDNASAVQARLKHGEYVLAGLIKQSTVWEEEIQNYKDALNTMLGGVLLASACAVYLGSVAEEKRAPTIARWLEFCKNAGIEVTSSFALSTLVDRHAWADTEAEMVRAAAAATGEDAGLPDSTAIPLVISDSTPSAALLATRVTLPLLVDESGNGLAWVLAVHRAVGTRVMEARDPDLVRTTCKCISRGRPLVVVFPADKDTTIRLPPALSAVARHDLRTNDAGKQEVIVGDETVTWHPSFRLYLLTTAECPDMAVSLLASVVPVRFSARASDVWQPTLSACAAVLLPDVQEAHRSASERLFAELRQKVAVAGKLLHTVTGVTGAVLREEAVVGGILACVDAVAAHNKAVVAAEDAVGAAAANRMALRPLADRAATMYGVLLQLPRLNALYVVTADKFVTWMREAVTAVCSETEAATVASARAMAAAVEAATTRVFSQVCTGIHERDMPAVAFLMAVREARTAGLVSPEEWETLRDGRVHDEPAHHRVAFGGSSNAAAAAVAKPNESWISDDAWAALTRLEASGSSVFKGLRQNISNEVDQWFTYVHSPIYYGDTALGIAASQTDLRQVEAVEGQAPTTSVDPPAAVQGMSDWQLMLVLRHLRPDVGVQGARRVVGRLLSPTMAHVGRIPLAELAASIDACKQDTPVVVVNAMTTDMVGQVLAIAAERHQAVKVLGLGRSLGDYGTGGWRDPGSTTEKEVGNVEVGSLEAAVSEAMQLGSWLVVLNASLAPREAEVIVRIRQRTTTAIHSSFRLIFAVEDLPAVSASPVAAPCAMLPRAFHGLPPLLLRSACVVIDDASSSIRKNLLQSYRNYNERSFLACKKTHLYKRLLFSLSFAKAAFSARKRFSTAGWQAATGISDLDMAAAQRVLRYLLDSMPHDTPAFPHVQAAMAAELTAPFSDSTDNKVFAALLGKFICDKAMDTKHPFSSTSSAYQSPGDRPVAAYKQFLENLPPIDPADLCGLDAAMNRMADHAATSTLFEAAKMLEQVPPPIITGPRPRDLCPIVHLTEIVKGMKAALATILPKSKAKNNAQYPHTLAIVHAEKKAYEKLLSCVVTDLQVAMAVIRRKSARSASMEYVWECVGQNHVPHKWILLSPQQFLDEKDLFAWMASLQQGITFLKTWLSSGLPAVVNLGWLYYPQAMLGGILQTAVLKQEGGHPLDHYGFEYIVYKTSANRDVPPDGVFLSGISLEGATWDYSTKSMTSIGSTGGRPRTALPLVWCKPGPMDNERRQRAMHTVPLYRTSWRETLPPHVFDTPEGVLRPQLIMTLELPVADSPDDWEEKGVAAMLE